MSSNFFFSIIGDFLSTTEVDIALLQSQLSEEPIIPIILAITKTGDDIDIFYDGNLSPTEISTLNVFIANYENIAPINANNLGEVKVQFETNIDPTPNDDETLGYFTGSRWYNTLGEREWVCMDNTTSNAVWHRGDIESHLELNDIGINTHTQIDDHMSNTNNPHSVSATQIGNDVAQWNANKIQNINVQNGVPNNGDILIYDIVSNQWVNERTKTRIFEDFYGTELPNLFLSDGNVYMKNGVGGIMVMNDNSSIKTINEIIDVNKYPIIDFYLKIINATNIILDFGVFGSTDQCKFIYNDTIDNNWHTECNTNNIDTTITSNTSFTKFTIQTNPSNIIFKINDSQVSNYNTNIPTEIMNICVNLNGVAKQIEIDYICIVSNR